MRITLLGFSSSIGSLILETLRNIDPGVEVTIIENMPRADDDVFAPEGSRITWVQANELTERPNGPFFLAMAKPDAKQATWKHFSERFGLQREELTTIVSPRATIASSAIIGKGTYIEPGVVVSPFARVGDMVTLNRGSTIGHHTQLGDLVNVGPGCHISGHCKVGDAVQFGVGSVTFDHITIGARTLIGGGGVVVKDVPADVVAWGNPCVVVKQRGA